MRRAIIIAVVYIFAATATAWAAAYEMVLNKDEKLCPAMLELVNEDLERYGKIAYQSHHEFAAIKWEPLEKVLGEKFKDSHCGIYRTAKFDINNDGRAEIVVKVSGCEKSQLTDFIYIFNADDPFFSSFSDLADLMDKNIGEFPSDETVLGGYHLKLIPPKDTTFGKFYQGPAGWMTLNPFLYEGASYLAVTDREGSRSEGRWFVIGKYKKAGELDDICYFRDKNARSAEPQQKEKGQR